jgi:oxygen-independent coproporphyrinogen-3 oxidase
MALIAPPLALYLHFPWCVRKCPYCDFNSHALKAELPQESYLEALLADLDAQPALIGDRPIVSLFLGGGTPSLFSPDAIGRLLEAIGKRLRIAGDAEITLEANPGTIERGRFGEYRAAGINRVSLGAQSFDPVMLERLGRIHSAAETRTAVAELRAAGLANFNIDLMYALPGQDLAGALADVRAAIELEPAHLSHYQLTMEPGTVFGGRPPPGLPDEDLSYEMQLSCQAELAAGGYAQYEISAYAREGAQCAHNLNYWNFGDYLGVGAGAHGKLSDGASGEVVRTVREREPRRYLARAHAVALQVTQVPKSDLPYEFMMNALRLRSGFERSQYEARTGLGFETISAAIRRLEGRGLLLAAGPEGKGWSPTEFGRRFLNDLIGEFLPVRPGA